VVVERVGQGDGEVVGDPPPREGDVGVLPGEGVVGGEALGLWMVSA
jgi:hypothetical protein